MSQTLLAETPVTAAGTTPQVAMTLAGLTYAPSPDQVQQLLAGGTLATGTDWSVVWGPATSEFSSNLMFVAYSATANTYAVAVRGTVLTFSLSTLVDLYEDLDVGTMVAWQYPATAGASIANGTSVGLADLLGITSNGQTLTQYLAAQGLPGSASILVTGHSLGGCLASVLAPYLQNWVNENGGSGGEVTACTFAAPTAGNQDFATFYTGLFGGDTRYFNSLDMVPFAWQDLGGIKNLYAGGPGCPWEMSGAIDLMEGWMDYNGVSYAQPGAGTGLAGTLAATTDWFTEVGDQHDHNTYLTLLNAPTLPF